ncbi:uncharacterized protein LOC109139456 isoform X2 [Larimichthys crocea]|uniref:uncharacterized protein LOC109139456 isoform X2 n=1 Tax=Larimichthys crocea TaxID=215358 RepID=UPI000F6016F1|nr:uncharacterized protein LOC109139456 isoform X2 [Larimichthys crocea]
MEDFSKHSAFSWTFSLICYMLWISSPAEGKTISEVVGSRVILHCPNNSINTSVQLVWKMNDVLLFSLNPKLKRLYENPNASRLNMNMSQSEDQLHKLIIERAQTFHTGNYTCEAASVDGGAQSETWELIIKEPSGENWPKLIVVVATTVPCVCFLIFIIVLAILHRVCKRHTENITQPPSADTKPEEIYENCLEAVPERNYIQPYRSRDRAH